jgi:hypothetical protein
MSILYKIITLAGAALFAVNPVFAQAPIFSSQSADIHSVNGGTALNWAGYVSASGEYTSVEGTWIVPRVTAVGDNSADATWVGIGGVASRDLIQAGTEALPDSAGNMVYQAWWEGLPGSSHAIDFPIHAGDSVTVAIKLAQPQDYIWRISFTNNTTGSHDSFLVYYPSALSSAEWIEEVPAGIGQQIVLDNFGTVQFKGGSTTLNGANVSIGGAGAHPLTMKNSSGETLALPSALGSDHQSFTVDRTIAPSTPLVVAGYNRIHVIVPDESADDPSVGSRIDKSMYSHIATIGPFKIYSDENGQLRIIVSL